MWLDSDLPVSRAAAQVHVFRLHTARFSQDGLDLEVDLVGDLWGSRAVRWCLSVSRPEGGNSPGSEPP